MQLPRVTYTSFRPNHRMYRGRCVKKDLLCIILSCIKVRLIPSARFVEANVSVGLNLVNGVLAPSDYRQDLYRDLQSVERP